METDCFIGGDAIAIKNAFWKSAPRKLERRLRNVLSLPGDGHRPLNAPGESIDQLDSITVETPNHIRQLYCRRGTSDKDVVWSVFDRRDYDLARLRRFAEIREWLEARHRAGHRALIIDAGANIGASACFFALTFPTALVIAIEPEPGNFELLVKNTRGLNVRCIQAALSSESGEAAILDPGEGNWGFRATRTASGGIPCLTINDLYRENCGEAVFPFIAKIDIEGGEGEVFAQHTEWVEKTPVLVAELHDWLLPKGRTALPFLRCVSQLDRDFVYLGEDVFSIANTLP
jgi:FkbM family methyltransferase